MQSIKVEVVRAPEPETHQDKGQEMVYQATKLLK